MVGLILDLDFRETQSYIALISEPYFPWENKGVSRMASYSSWEVKEEG